MLDKLYPTREEVIKDYLAFQESIKDLPRIDVRHLDEIKNFLNAHLDIQTSEEAEEVLAYLYSLENEWKEYYKIIPSQIYPNIHLCIAAAYVALKQPNDAINILEKCISVIENATEYRYLFRILADMHTGLATLYHEQNNPTIAHAHMQKSVRYLLTQFNQTSYKDYAFYSFRPLRDYVLEGIKENIIYLSDPTTFNDPLDPVLLTHIQRMIETATDEQEKKLFQLQKDVYDRVRIASLCRGRRLPEGEEVEDRSLYSDPPFSEINKSYMWGYYADSHKGICIKYVFPENFTSERDGEVLILRNVNYEDWYNPQSDTFSYRQAFFSKGKDWAHEGECRLVYYKEDGEVDTYHKVKLPENCITEIYVGYAASAEDKSQLKGVLKDYPNVRLFLMRLSKNNLFELEPEEISIDQL